MKRKKTKNKPTMPNQINNHYHLVQTAAHNILSEPSYFTRNLCDRLAI